MLLGYVPRQNSQFFLTWNFSLIFYLLLVSVRVWGFGFWASFFVVFNSCYSSHESPQPLHAATSSLQVLALPISPSLLARGSILAVLSPPLTLSQLVFLPVSAESSGPIFHTLLKNKKMKPALLVQIPFCFLNLSWDDYILLSLCCFPPGRRAGLVTVAGDGAALSCCHRALRDMKQFTESSLSFSIL